MPGGASCLLECLEVAEAALWCYASLTLPYLRVQRKIASQKGEKNAPCKAFHVCCVNSCLVLGVSEVSGSERKNVEPAPSLEVNQIRPPCHSMSSRQR